jgi:hypothetical protein
MRELLRKFNRAAMTASPGAAYARLHYIVPLALVAIAALLIVGLRFPDTRETRPASALITSESVKQSYREHLRIYRKLVRDEAYDPSSPLRKTLAPLYRKAAQVAESEGLRCAEELPDYLESQVWCDTRRLADDALLGIFWGSLGLAAICAMLWLFVQFRESWMLPNWSSHLWYTPAYATALVALGIGPFLMLAVYHSRATDYLLGADGWKLGRLGKEFYLLVFLQLTVLCIAAVELRPSAVRFIIGAPILLVIAGLATALCAVVFVLFDVSPAEPWIWLLPVLVGVLAAVGGLAWWLWRRRRASARARAPFIHRVFQLSQILLIAWLIYAIDAGLRLADARTGTLHDVLTTLCFAVCVLHVIGSRWAELRFPERRSSGLRRSAVSYLSVPDRAR